MTGVRESTGKAFFTKLKLPFQYLHIFCGYTRMENSYDAGYTFGA
jgi:hypothetical protein